MGTTGMCPWAVTQGEVLSATDDTVQGLNSVCVSERQVTRPEGSKFGKKGVPT